MYCIELIREEADETISDTENLLRWNNWTGRIPERRALTTQTSVDLGSRFVRQNIAKPIDIVTMWMPSALLSSPKPNEYKKIALGLESALQAKASFVSRGKWVRLDENGSC